MAQSIIATVSTNVAVLSVINVIKTKRGDFDFII